MSTDEGTPGPDPLLYPEVVRAGGLVNALHAEFDLIGLTLRAQLDEDPACGGRVASVQDTDRRTKVTLSARERRFRMSVRSGKVTMASGFAPDLAAVADVARRWHGGARLPELAAAWPFLGSVALAECRERDDALEAAWLSLYENHTQDAVRGRLHSFVALAFHEPSLRRLRPFTSHWTLGFSTAARYPWSGAHPSVHPLEPGTYLVRAADGRELGVADAAGSLALVLAALEDSPSGQPGA
ncbi:DUF6193 family natural product biosynthesis protein [Catellatospora tritici]|uniref:DUF6193 family natural product biosynthesis protein n=1 Tax=Catellatospora tritici TaxID=2851566 RepID=UPI001C2D79D6|nr:DUF6193 family natural product biosynthesis protein [Catellatospora tritici]MBV1852601.1 hypothetical protein [Catellatospora tritici]